MCLLVSSFAYSLDVEKFINCVREIASRFEPGVKPCVKGFKKACEQQKILSLFDSKLSARNLEIDYDLFSERVMVHCGYHDKWFFLDPILFADACNDKKLNLINEEELFKVYRAVAKQEDLEKFLKKIEIHLKNEELNNKENLDGPCSELSLMKEYPGLYNAYLEVDCDGFSSLKSKIEDFLDAK